MMRLRAKMRRWRRIKLEKILSSGNLCAIARKTILHTLFVIQEGHIPVFDPL